MNCVDSARTILRGDPDYSMRVNNPEYDCVRNTISRCCSHCRECEYVNTMIEFLQSHSLLWAATRLTTSVKLSISPSRAVYPWPFRAGLLSESIDLPY